jgi:hypothetical protein
METDIMTIKIISDGPVDWASDLTYAEAVAICQPRNDNEKRTMRRLFGFGHEDDKPMPTSYIELS